MKPLLVFGGVVLAFVLIGLIGLAMDDDKPTPASGATQSPSVGAGGSAEAVPPYQLETGKKPSNLRVTVDRLYTLPEMTAIVADLQHRYADQPDGYFVQINCSVGGTASLDYRLANAKFAVGRIGAARTGLDDGDREVIMVVGDRQCPPDPLATAAAGATTAQQVVDAIIAAGLPARNPRDNSQSNCRSIGCVQLITTDDVSVYQFPADASALKFAGASPFGVSQRGPIVLVFHGDTPDHRYQPVLNRIVAQ